jgi:hypothetical protein
LKHFNDRLGYQHYGRYFITARYAELVENQSCIQNRITQHLQLTGWKSLLVFILLLKSYCRKHNAEMKTMMTAQNLLGKINATKNTVFYCIYQYAGKCGVLEL